MRVGSLVYATRYRRVDRSDLKGKTGVYCFVNLVNGKRYVGSAAVSLERRLKQHVTNLRGGYHVNKHLQAAWKRYRESRFKVIVLEFCAPPLCICREQYWIDYYQSSSRIHGYNSSPKAGSQLGLRHTEETRKLLSSKSKAAWERLTPTQRLKFGRGMQGRKHLPDAIEKIRVSSTGRLHSTETKAKISLYQRTVTAKRNKTKSHRDNLRAAWIRRRKNGPTQREIEGHRKASAKLIGSKRSNEARARISASLKGKLKSKETKMKIAASLLGRKLTEEHKAAISAGFRKNRGG